MMSFTRRELLTAMTAAAFSTATVAIAQSGLKAQQAKTKTFNTDSGRDRIFICNEDSSTLSVINPYTNQVDTTINLTSFDEDPRPPFRFVTGGMMPTHAAMSGKPLYHGAINIHGSAPSPDSRLLAVTGRGTSNIYLIDIETKRVLGNKTNPFAKNTTADVAVNSEWLTSGILVGREPHEPTFTRNGKELWVTLRGENKIAILEVQAALKALQQDITVGVVREYIDTLNGPAQVWFSQDGKTAFVISQKESIVEVFDVNSDRQGFSRPRLKMRLDTKAIDPYGFIPFQKITPDGQEIWFSHKAADTLSVWEAQGHYRLRDRIQLNELARPNHIEFVENERGKVAYATFARVDDNSSSGVASSPVAIIDRSAPPGERRVAVTFFSHGREAHGLWTNPENTRLYIAHEQDELPGTPAAGQTVCTVFDVSNPLQPEFIAQIPLGELKLPSGNLRNKKSINLVYVRPGAQSQTA
jgi:YVTN family beta-propeller protein